MGCETQGWHNGDQGRPIEPVVTNATKLEMGGGVSGVMVTVWRWWQPGENNWALEVSREGRGPVERKHREGGMWNATRQKLTVTDCYR